MISLNQSIKLTFLLFIGFLLATTQVNAFDVAEYKQFLSIAYGSLLELETQYLLATDLKYMAGNEIIEKLLKEVGAMLYRMLNPIR